MDASLKFCSCLFLFLESETLGEQVFQRVLRRPFDARFIH